VRTLRFLTTALVNVTIFLVMIAVSTAQQIRRVSVSTSGAEANGDSILGNSTDVQRVISDNGRWVVFASTASNLDETRPDTNVCSSNPDINAADVFVRDLWFGTTERVSLSYLNEQGNAPSWRPAISAEDPNTGHDGRYVVFQSDATNLVPGVDENGAMDIFVVDRDGDNDFIYDERQQAGGVRISRVSVGIQGGQFVEANGSSAVPSISRDGRYVVFESAASNLTDDDTNCHRDIFLVDRDADPDLTQPNGIYDEAPPRTTITRISAPECQGSQNCPPESTCGAGGAAGRRQPAIRANGQQVVFHTFWKLIPADNDPPQAPKSDVYLYNRLANPHLSLVSVRSDGQKGNDSSKSAYIDGTIVVFESAASNLDPLMPSGILHIYVRDLAGGGTTSEAVDRRDANTLANTHSKDPTISRDGRYVAFHSQATNLIAGYTDTATGIDPFAAAFDLCEFQPILNCQLSPCAPTWDIFLRDRTAGTTVRVSQKLNAPSGVEADNTSIYPSISCDGRYVVFQSLASDLVATDTNGKWDIFVYDRDWTP
jgi:Tol biopolymer transport system component